MTKRFLDLCAGIGGGHLGIVKAFPHAKCIGFSEIDKGAIDIYKEYFPDSKFLGNLEHIDASSLEDFDILIAGFPCQPFSVNGNREGFKGKQGNVFKYIYKIVEHKKPPFLLLENVRGLVNHDCGKTFDLIVKSLESLGYFVKYKVLKSSFFGVPQSRQRVYICAFLSKEEHDKFSFPEGVLCDSFSDIQGKPLLLRELQTLSRRLKNKKFNSKNLEDIIDNLKEGSVVDIRQTDIRVYQNSFPTIRASKHGLMFVKDGQLFSLGGQGALNLQGFPKHFYHSIKHLVTEGKLLFYSGNAMTVNVIYYLFKAFA